MPPLTSFKGAARFVEGMPCIIEGGVKVALPAQRGKDPTRGDPIFFNPAMRISRDILIALLCVLRPQGWRACFALAGSGVRALRAALELPDDAFSRIVINDLNPQAYAAIERNVAANGLDGWVADGRIVIEREHAARLLLRRDRYELIEIDPFGSPNPFLDAAVRALADSGLLALSATDTAALAGAYARVCRRKYWAEPLNTHAKHEVGLRILIRKAQLVAAQHGVALEPLLSYAHEHHYRAIMRARRGRRLAEAVLKAHRWLGWCARCGAYYVYDAPCGVCGCGAALRWAGPLWAGPLGDAAVAADAAALAEGDAHTLLDQLSGEYAIGSVGLHSTHLLCKLLHLDQVPAVEEVIAQLRGEGARASRTHLLGEGLRTDADHAMLLRSLKAALRGQ